MHAASAGKAIVDATVMPTAIAHLTASRVIGELIKLDNCRRLHQALGMKTLAEAFASAARPA